MLVEELSEQRLSGRSPSPGFSLKPQTPSSHLHSFLERGRPCRGDPHSWRFILVAFCLTRAWRLLRWAGLQPSLTRHPSEMWRLTVGGGKGKFTLHNYSNDVVQRQAKSNQFKKENEEMKYNNILKKVSNQKEKNKIITSSGFFSVFNTSAGFQSASSLYPACIQSLFSSKQLSELLLLFQGAAARWLRAPRRSAAVRPRSSTSWRPSPLVPLPVRLWTTRLTRPVTVLPI